MGDLPSVSAQAAQNEELFRSPSVKAQANRLASDSPAPKLSKLPGRRVAKSKNKKVLVPNIPQPLFHPISKAKLQPGQEVPETVPDDTWLIQKHQESIGEFTDVDATEKEYIWEWDGFILRKSITSAAYFPRAFLDFVEEKAAWLVAENHRMIEFGKHCSVLLARDLLGDDTMKLAFEHINAARSESATGLNGPSNSSDSSHGGDGASRQSPRSTQIRKSSSGCNVCQLPVLGPTLLLCSNKVGSLRLSPANFADPLSRYSPVRGDYITRPASRKPRKSPSRNVTGAATHVARRKFRARSPIFCGRGERPGGRSLR